MAIKALAVYAERKKTRNKGVHAKSKSPHNKNRKFYKKKYRGQGKKR